jgi:hypothetical protein
MTHKIANSTKILITAVVLVALPAMAQDIQPSFPVTLDKKLAARATNVNEVTLDKKMLQFAGQFLDSKEKDDVQAQHLIRNLNGIYVREYEFDKPGQYSAQDLEAVRKQFSGPEWSPMVREHSLKGQADTDVYMKMVKGQVEGMFVLDAGPKELDFVYISGPIRPQDLKDLSGNFGIPKVNPDKVSKGAGQ